MKKFYLCVLLFYCLGEASAQSWNIQGNSGLTTNNFLGTTDKKDLIFKANSVERGRLTKNGLWRFGKSPNFLKIDSVGKLSFSGSGGYYVQANKYVFRNDVNSKIGLFYNGTGPKFEFRNKSGKAIFSINDSNGNGILTGTLKVGNYTLPTADGNNGQVLKTNGQGKLSWSNDNGLSYTAGNEIDIDGGSIAVRDFKTDPILFNTGIGTAALYFNTTGSYNVAAGYKSLYQNTTGSENSGNGYLSLNANTKGFANSAFGAYSLALNTTGAQNTAIGDGALYSNTTGLNNTVSGFGAAFFNTSGSNNTASGHHSLQSNTSGNENTASGYQSLFHNTSGGDNVAIGANALYTNKIGSELVAVGAYALYNQGTDSIGGSYNTALGYKSLFNNSTGINNTAAGYSSMINCTTGSNNSGFGSGVLYQNTTGGANTAIGSFAANRNTTGTANGAVGFFALYNNQAGNYNNAMGYEALYNTTGSQNTAIGALSLSGNITGNNNVAIGMGALGTSATGDNNTAIGAYTDVTASNLAFTTAIGYGAIVDASNKVRIGGTTINSIGGQVGWTTFSDGRFKKNIKENVPGLKFINMLKPVSYTVDVAGLNAYYDKKIKHDSAHENFIKEMQTSTGKASAIIHDGFIAQDVEKAAATLHYDFSGVDKPQTDDGLYGLRYSEFVVPLVKAVQELSKMNNEKDARIDSLQKQYEDLKALVLKIQDEQQRCSPCSNNANATMQESTSQQYMSVINNASLEQNVPNPFTNSTSIGYYLPQKFSFAKIIVTDKNGRALQQLNLSTPGKGTIYVNASAMSSGAYNYSLYVDGRLIATKQMVSAK